MCVIRFRFIDGIFGVNISSDKTTQYENII